MPSNYFFMLRRRCLVVILLSTAPSAGARHNTPMHHSHPIHQSANAVLRQPTSARTILYRSRPSPNEGFRRQIGDPKSRSPAPRRAPIPALERLPQRAAENRSAWGDAPTHAPKQATPGCSIGHRGGGYSRRYGKLLAHKPQWKRLVVAQCEPARAAGCGRIATSEMSAGKNII